MFRTFLFLCLMTLCLVNASAQFTSAQKDSVLNELGYVSGQISMTISFQAGDYSTVKQPEPFKGLTEEQILAKKTNTFRDASIYKYLCLQALNVKNDRPTAEKQYALAIEHYSTWMDTEFMDPTPFLEILGLFYGTQTYNPISNVLNEALVRFPQNKEVLDWACLINLDLFKNFDKVNLHVNELHALEPYNLNACFYSVMASQYKYLLALNSGDFNQEMNISMALKAQEAKPNEVGYQHLVHYAKVSSGYLKSASVFLQSTQEDETDYDKFFNSLNAEQLNDFEAAEVFFKKQLNSKNPPSRLILLNSLGFVNMYLNKRDVAKKYFQTLYEEDKTVKNLENLILISVVEKRWSDSEVLLEKAIANHNNTKAYLSLMGIYSKFMKNEKKQLATVQRVEKLGSQDESKNILLATWYLKQQNIEKAKQYCSLLNPDSESTQWRYLALSVLINDKENSKVCLDKILELSPNDVEAVKLKKQLEL